MNDADGEEPTSFSHCLRTLREQLERAESPEERAAIRTEIRSEKAALARSPSEAASPREDADEALRSTLDAPEPGALEGDGSGASEPEP